MDDFQSMNPYTFEVAYNHEATALDGLDSVVRKAHTDFLLWKEKSFEERAVHFQHLRQMMLNLTEEYGEIASNEMGKPITEAIKEVEKCADLCNFYSKNAKTFLKTEYIETEFHKSLVTYEPMGVIFGVMPWNYPYWQILRFAIPALMAGNAVIIKPAPNVFQCAKALEHLFWEAEFPKHLFQVVYINEALTPLIIKEKKIQGVAFTGSAEGGSVIAALAGKYLKKTIVELGGNDPFIILDDANIQEAVKAVVASRFSNCGQACIAAKRLIITAGVAEEVIPLIEKAIDALVLGDPLDKNTQLGPLARPDLLDRLEEQVNQSIKAGAKVLKGGKRIKDSNFFEPTILTDVPKGCPAYEDELFGPVLSIFIVENEEKAIELANDSDYGLGASVWTKDLKHGEKIAKKIEAGQVFVNRRVRSDARLPFGGTKQSGYGRELSVAGIREFTDTKVIVVD
mgnify:CR=1 FL=1